MPMPPAASKLTTTAAKAAAIATAGIGSRRHKGARAVRRPANSPPGSTSEETGRPRRGSSSRAARPGSTPPRLKRPARSGARRPIPPMIPGLRTRRPIGRRSAGGRRPSEPGLPIAAGPSDSRKPRIEPGPGRSRPRIPPWPRPRGTGCADPGSPRSTRAACIAGTPRKLPGPTPAQNTGDFNASARSPMPPGDHAPGSLPVFPSIPHRHRRLGQHFAIEPAGGQAGPRPAGATIARPQPPAVREPGATPAAGIARPRCRANEQAHPGGSALGQHQADRGGPGSPVPLSRGGPSAIAPARDRSGWTTRRPAPARAARRCSRPASSPGRTSDTLVRADQSVRELRRRGRVRGDPLGRQDGRGLRANCAWSAGSSTPT